MKILVPYDGSPSSERAVEYSLRIATAVGKPSVDVHLLNVQAADASVAGFWRDAADVAAQLVRDGRDAGAKLLERVAKAVENAGVKSVERAVLLGDPAEIIGAYVENAGCDMVVMGTRGLSPVGGLLLGSVTSKVIHAVKVPVTLVK